MQAVLARDVLVCGEDGDGRRPPMRCATRRRCVRRPGSIVARCGHGSGCPTGRVPPGLGAGSWFGHGGESHCLALRKEPAIRVLHSARRPPWHDSLEGFPTVSIPGRRSIPRADRVGTTGAVGDSTSIRGHGFPRARESPVVPCAARRSCPRCATGRGRPPNNVPNLPLPSKWPPGWAWCCRWVTMPPPNDGKTIQVAKGAPQTFARIGRGCR